MESGAEVFVTWAACLVAGAVVVLMLYLAWRAWRHRARRRRRAGHFWERGRL